jgi:hypothetical protein
VPGSQDIKAILQQAVADQLVRIDNKECIQSYGISAFEDPPYGNLLLVTSAKLNDSVIDYKASYGSDLHFFYPNDRAVLMADPATWTIEDATHCQASYPVLDPHDGSCDESCYHRAVTCEPVATPLPLAYCLAEPYIPKCNVRLARNILMIVAACNAVKIMAMFICAFCMFTPLATIGDAVASFLEDPDPQSGAQGPLSLVDVREPDRSNLDTMSARVYHRKLLRWRSAANVGGYWSRWWLGLFTLVYDSCLVCCNADQTDSALLLLICGLALVVYLFVFYGYDTPEAAHQFGNNPEAAVIHSTASASLSFNILLPNVPQVLVSFIYIFYNNALTYMLLAYEWTQFATDRKALRVTSPAGQQRSTFRLQLPYRYALSLMMTMAILHWLISQSLFLVQINFYDRYGVLTPGRSTNACGFSPFAILPAVIVGAILILALIVTSFRKLESGIPVVGSCSLAISAACGNSMEANAALKPLMYGVLGSRAPDENGIHYVGFSQYDVTPLVDGVAYL